MDKMIITTTETIPNREIVQILDIARGSTVRARNIGNDIMASFKNIVGGEVEEYTKLQAESREQALQRMIKDGESFDTIYGHSVFHYFDDPTLCSTANVLFTKFSLNNHSMIFYTCLIC